MSRTDPALRAMRRDLLVARAALEREELLEHMDTLRGRSRPARIVANAAASGMYRLRNARYAGVGRAALRVLVRNPWLIASLLAALRRGPLLRLGVLGVAAAGAAWWWSRHLRAAPAQPELPFDAQAGELDDLGI